MAAYSEWMNRHLYAVCAELSDVERRQDRAAFFKSIHGTLNHLLLADKIWLGHHRGQITAMLSQCGKDYGVTDLIAFRPVDPGTAESISR